MTTQGDDYEQLIDGYRLYDEYSDIVSSMQWLFTDTTKLPNVVTHFERFPRFAVNGVDVTPDFTVLFSNGNAIIGEIARISQRPESVQKLAKQVGAYSSATSVPTTKGRSKVQEVGVLLLMPVDVAAKTVDRLILKPEHDVQLSKAPCIANYSRDTKRYNYNRIRDPGNGDLPDNGSGADLVGYLNSSLGTPISAFAPLKAQYPFTNDPVDTLYLATHLYTKTWPTLHGDDLEGDVQIDVDATLKELRLQSPSVKKREILRALALLREAERANCLDGQWAVNLGRIRSKTHGSEIHSVLAERASRTRTKPTKRATSVDQLTLL